MLRNFIDKANKVLYNIYIKIRNKNNYLDPLVKSLNSSKANCDVKE